MPDLDRGSITRIYQDLSSRASQGLHSVHSSLRSFGHLCRNQLSSHLPTNSSVTPSNSFLGHDVEQNSSSNVNNTNSSTPDESVPTETSEPSSTLPQRGQDTQSRRHSCPRSSRRLHGNGRHTYHRHSYRNGLMSVRSVDKDRNVLAAILSVVVIAVLATALAQPRWFSIYNDLCTARKTESFLEDQSNKTREASLNPSDESIPYRHQVVFRPFHSNYALSPVTIYGLTPDARGCVTPEIVTMKRTIIGLCFLAIMCSLVQFFMDTVGTRRKWVNKMRVHAIGNVLTVFFCVLIVAVCFWVSILYERVQLHQLMRHGRPGVGSYLVGKHQLLVKAPAGMSQFEFIPIHQVEVKFELSYYLVTLAGFVSIVAAAANLFTRTRPIFIERISDYRCSRSRLRHSDQNSLLSSDVLNNDYLPFYSPNGWIFDPHNWALYYPSSTASGGEGARTSISPPCPPPPPYSP